MGLDKLVRMMIMFSLVFLKVVNEKPIYTRTWGILLEVIFGDTYSITFGDGLVILKPQPNYISIRYSVYQYK